MPSHDHHKSLIRSSRKTFIWTFLTLVLAAQASWGQTVIRTVGAAPNCSFGNLQAAVDFMASRPASETKIIRLAYDMEHLNVEVTIEDVSLTLVGGYASCSAPEPTDFQTFIFGTGSNPVFYVISDEPQEVRVESLSITGGGGDSGGGIRANGPVSLEVRNSGFFNHHVESLGGAIALANGATLDLADSTFISNSASLGGAVSCVHQGQVDGRDGNSFQSNLSRHSGGAIYSAPCTMTLEGSHDFAVNSARSGGAIFSSGDLLLRSTSDGRIVFQENRGEVATPSRRYGGAIFQAGGDLTVRDVLFTGNSLDTTDNITCGGAIASTGPGSLVRIESTARSCDGGPCSVFDGNQAPQGAAICIGTGRVEILRTRIEDHAEDDGVPAESVLDFSRFGSTDVVLEGAMVTGNSADVVFQQLDSSADVTIAYSTFAENRNASRVIDVAPSGATGAGAAGPTQGEIKILSSLFWEFPEVDIFSGPGLVPDTECLLLSEIQTLPLPAHWLNSDPRFLAPGSDDYRLHETSPAIDFCEAGSYVVPSHGIDHGRRGVDDPATLNAGAGRVYDIGADEFGSDESLFADGFESGTMASWTAGVG